MTKRIFEENETKVAIIILNYNGYADTIDCVESLQVIDYPHDIIVVDNCSTDNSVGILNDTLGKTIKLISCDKNLGYAGGNNVGLKYAYECGYQFFCILNNDTNAEEDFLTPCIERIAEDRRIAFIGPAIVDYDNDIVQSTGGDVFTLKGISTSKNRGKNVDSLERNIPADYVGGACIVFSRIVLENIGYIPECYFLFFEETEWCYRALKKGYYNLCLGYTQIRHKGSASVKRLLGLGGYLFSRSKIAFLRRNYPIKIIAFAIFLLLCLKALTNINYSLGDKKNVIRGYIDGWTKKVNLHDYPFVIINE